MRNFIAAALALSGTGILAGSPAGATPFSYLGDAVGGAPLKGLVSKAHSRRQVHDMLHDYGYDRVVYRSRYYDEHDKPVYRFRVCMGRRAFMIDVNWYGHVMDEHRAGRCHRYF